MASELVTPPPGETKSCALCKEPICPFCGDVQDAPYVCPSCGMAYHDCCAARYSVQNHIGIQYIFRCPNCTTLLKVDPESVMNLGPAQVGTLPPQEGYDTGLLQQIVGPEGQSPESTSAEGHPENLNLSEIPQPEEIPTTAPVSTPPGPPGSPPLPTSTGPRFLPVKGPGFFRPRVPLKPPSGSPAPATAPQKDVWKPPTEVVPMTPEASQNIKPPVKPPPVDVTRRPVTRVLVCRICGQSLPQKAARCPNCGGIVTQN